MFDNPYMIGMWAFVYLLGCYITYFGFKYAEEQLEPHFKVYKYPIRFVSPFMAFNSIGVVAGPPSLLLHR